LFAFIPFAHLKLHKILLALPFARTPTFQKKNLQRIRQRHMRKSSETNQKRHASPAVSSAPSATLPVNSTGCAMAAAASNPSRAHIGTGVS
jgi:hypothetical protein